MQPTTVVEIGQDDNQGTTESWVTQEDNLLAQHKVFWFIYTIAANVGVMLSIGYWTVIYDGDAIDVRNVSKHILNAVLMLVETVVSSVPVHLYHRVYAMIFFNLHFILHSLQSTGSRVARMKKVSPISAKPWTGTMSTPLSQSSFQSSLSSSLR